MKKNTSTVQAWLARSFGHFPRFSGSSESSGVLPASAQSVCLDREEFCKRCIHGLLGSEKIDRCTTTATISTGNDTSATTPSHIAELLHAVDQEIRPLMTDLVPIVGDMIQRKCTGELGGGFS